MNVVEFKDFISDIVNNKRSGVLKAYRKVFGDPLLYAYFLRGVPVYASSFVVKDKWYDGLLSQEEVDNNIFGNIFKYSYDTYGKRFLEHIVNYSGRVLKEVLSSIVENGWEVETEFQYMTDEQMEESIGITKVSTLEGWARSLISIGASGVYLPKSGRTFGMIRKEILSKLYGVITSNFDEVDAIYSTPFVNAFLLHKDNEPVLVSTPAVLGFDEMNSFKKLFTSTKPFPFVGNVEMGTEYDFPVIDGVGKPFALTLRRGKNAHLVIIFKRGKVAHIYTMDMDGVLSTVTELNEKMSSSLYRALEMVGGSDLPQSVVDLQLRVLMMTNPHPEDFLKEAEKKLKAL